MTQCHNRVLTSACNPMYGQKNILKNGVFRRAGERTHQNNPHAFSGGICGVDERVVDAGAVRRQRHLVGTAAGAQGLRVQ